MPESGELATAVSEAADLPALNLSDALAIVLLMAEQEHPSFARPAAQRLVRLGIEHRVGLEDCGFALDAMRLLRDPLAETPTAEGTGVSSKHFSGIGRHRGNRRSTSVFTVAVGDR